MSVKNKEQERQSMVIRHFFKIDQFLKKYSEKFYQEYKDYDKELIELRKDFQQHEDELKARRPDSRFQFNSDEEFSEVEMEKKVSQRLNKIIITLARLGNPQLCKSISEHGIDLPELDVDSCDKIPQEADAVLFTTNPLLIFHLLNDQLRFRNKKYPLIYNYITIRLSKWLYRFNQFVFNYDDYDKVIRLTFLRPQRFSPYKHQFLHSIQMLCTETREKLLARKEPHFVNELRRVYFILTKSLLISSVNGTYPPLDIRLALRELVPVINLNQDELKKSAVSNDFLSRHLSSPLALSKFIESYKELKKQDSHFTFEFLGFLHPEDRFILINTLYKNSKSEVLRLFLDLRSIYLNEGQELPIHYEEVVDTIHQVIHDTHEDSHLSLQEELLEIYNTMRSVVKFEEVIEDPEVSKSMIDEAFVNGTLCIEDLSEVKPIKIIDSSDLELEEIKNTDANKELTSENIFSAFFRNRHEAMTSTYLLELARLSYCYMTVEYGKTQFNLFTIGELLLVDMDQKPFKEILDYLVNTKQMTGMERKVFEKQIPTLTALMKKINPQKKVMTPVEMYDRNKMLQFHKFKVHLEQVRHGVRFRFPGFLKFCDIRDFNLETISEIERHVAREENELIHNLDIEVIFKFLNSTNSEVFLHSLKQSPLGRKSPEQLKLALNNIDKFKQQAVLNLIVRKNLLTFERNRFNEEDTESKNLIAENRLAKTKKEKPGINDIENIFYVKNVRNSVFQSLMDEPEDKQRYLFELSRLPFRFMLIEKGKTYIFLITLADIIAMRLGGKGIALILQFLVKTGQIDNLELSIIKKYLPEIAKMLGHIFKRSNYEKANLELLFKDNKINFNELNRLVMISDNMIRTTINTLVVLKDHTNFLFTGVAEVENWLSRKANKPFMQIPPSHVMDMLNDKIIIRSIYEEIKKTVFGKNHLEGWVLSDEEIGHLRDYFATGYKMRLRLIKFSKTVAAKS